MTYSEIQSIYKQITKPYFNEIEPTPEQIEDTVGQYYDGLHKFYKSMKPEHKALIFQEMTNALEVFIYINDLNNNAKKEPNKEATTDELKTYYEIIPQTIKALETIIEDNARVEALNKEF